MHTHTLHTTAAEQDAFKDPASFSEDSLYYMSRSSSRLRVQHANDESLQLNSIFMWAHGPQSSPTSDLRLLENT